MPSDVIYLDHNATTPLDPRVLEAMLPYFTELFGNAASIDHNYGYEAKQAVDRAREQIASVINARADEIIFTSGATESDNIALFGVAEKYAGKGDHIITCVTEHKAVLDCCRRLEEMGKRVTYLPVDQYGLVDPEDVRRAITPQTILISIMAANNEIGTLAFLQEIGAIAKERGMVVDEIVRAAGQLARQRYGALMIIERETGLQDYAESGVPIDAKLTRQLLINIFYPNSPLHDGAVLTRGDRIVAASVVLPLTDNISASSQLGTRHRAAIGVTEDSDALAVVVSEETGQIAVAHSGRLIRGLDQDRLRRVLRTLMRLDREEPADGATSGRFHLPSTDRVRVRRTTPPNGGPKESTSTTIQSGD